MNELLNPADFPESEKWKLVKPIREGWSKDQKFYIEPDLDPPLLLRISDPPETKAETLAWQTLENANFSDPLISKLLKTGSCQAGTKVYRLFSWIEGDDASEKLNQLPVSQQYQLGIRAGKALHKIHLLPCPADWIPWDEHFERKIDRNIRLYRN